MKPRALGTFTLLERPGTGLGGTASRHEAGCAAIQSTACASETTTTPRLSDDAHTDIHTYTRSAGNRGYATPVVVIQGQKRAERAAERRATDPKTMRACRAREPSLGEGPDDGRRHGVFRHPSSLCLLSHGRPSLPRKFCFYHTSLGHIPLSALSTQLRPSQQEQKQRGSAGYIADLGALDNTSRCDPQALSETASSGPGSLEPRADADSVRRTLAWATHCETSVDSAPTLFPAMMGHDA